MDSEPHMQLDLSHHIPGVHDGISPQLLPESLFRSTLCQLDTQNDGIIGLPIFSSLQEQSFKVLHADRSGGSYDGLLHKGNLNTHQLCLGDSSLASTSLGNLATRNGLNDQVNNPEVALHQEVPLESLRDMFSGGYTYASSSSIPTSANYGYDSLPGNANANGNWDQNRCLMQPELSWRTSTSGLEPLQFNENQNAGLWVLPNSANDCSNNPYGTSISHNELSLSLATCRPSLPCSTSIQECCSDLRGDKGLSLGFPSNSRPIQFSQIISGSKYLGVLKQIFSDIASYSLATIGQNSISTGLTSSNSSHPFSSNHFNDPGISFKSTRDLCNDDPSLDSVESSYQEVEFKKSQLLSLLQVVDDCYNRSLDEIHTVLSAFRAATELEPQVLACFAIRTISFFYKNLRERICNEILAMGFSSGSTRDNNGRSFERCLIQKQWALQQLKRKDQQLWRPQRGLPERSVSVLRAWMFDNFLHPYPKDAEKHLLAIKSGLTRSQVSNWFINARVRLWKPLVEEMCAELNRRKGGCQNDEVTNYSNNHRSQLSIYDYNQRFEN